ncbi:MAG: glycosyltransferase family 2 protein [bacterium]|nr:glycosyltransferase family 2 protein [bacterium]
MAMVSASSTGLNQSTGKSALTVYVIIVTYNGEPWIEKCLQTLLQGNYPIKILIVDNGSTDRTQDILQQFPQVKLLPQTENLGFGRANNVGIWYALQQQADFVFLLNQDTFVEPDTISKLVETAQNYPAYGLLSPTHMNGDGSALDANFAACLLRPSNPSNTSLLSRSWSKQEEPVYPIGFVNAAAWLLSRRCLEMAGGFDPLFFFYGEDHDLFQRIQFHGFKTGLVSSALIYHVRGKNPTGALSFRQQLQKKAAYQNVVDEAFLKDISRPLFILSLLWFWRTIRKLVRMLLQLRIMNILILVSAAFKTAKDFPSLLQHRQLNRQAGRHWIDDATNQRYINNG